MALFNSVEYGPGLEDNSWFGKVEDAYNVCSAPGRWLAAEIGGGKKLHYYPMRSRGV